MNAIEILRSPLTQSGKPGDFIRLVLAEAGRFGMDGKTIAVLDDCAALLGYYEPLPAGQAGHLAGPIVKWRTHPDQLLFERVHDVERLVFQQRALLAFGGGPPGQTVGTAEICCAMGNIAQGTAPPEYYEVFTSASLDVLSILTGRSKENILRDHGREKWRLISNDDVLQPGGRLYACYQEVATSIRREAIAALDKDPGNPRKYLRPVAAHFIETHMRVRREAEAEGLTEIVERLDDAMTTIREMFPNLGSVDSELPETNDVERETDF